MSVRRVLSSLVEVNLERLEIRSFGSNLRNLQALLL